MVRLFTKKNSKGFTLVELLIVVAIIGILSTIGIPTFRRMVQKSKKGEAKVNLGNLYTTEAAFYSEYGAYGNNLQVMGYEMGQQNQNTATLVYAIGFVTNTCTSDTNTAIVPTNTTTWGAAITTNLPQYFNTGFAQSTYGRTTEANCYAANDPASGTNFTQYVASASGVVAPGINRDNGGTPAPGGNVDVWTMDETRALSNIYDGVQ